MPRTTSTQVTSAFSRVRKQVLELLVGVRREIRFKEAGLARVCLREVGRPHQGRGHNYGAESDVFAPVRIAVLHRGNLRRPRR